MDSRSERKRQAILDAAAQLFLAGGYQGTSMDEIAALAEVSKQTVYKNFADKQQLFRETVLGAASRADDFARALPSALPADDDLEASLTALARRYLSTVMQPGLLRLRRLVISEAGRFPELASDYYARVPEHVLVALADQFARLAENGLLRVDDPAQAASHYAYLVLGQALDTAMFLGAGRGQTTDDLNRMADAAVQVFLAAYRARS